MFCLLDANVLSLFSNNGVNEKKKSKKSSNLPGKCRKRKYFFRIRLILYKITQKFLTYTTNKA